MHCWCAWLLARTPPAKIATSLHLGSSCHWMHPITQAPSSPIPSSIQPNASPSQSDSATTSMPQASHLTRPSNSKLHSRSMPVAASQCNASPNQGLECHRLHPIQFQSIQPNPVGGFSKESPTTSGSSLQPVLHLLPGKAHIQDHLNIPPMQCIAMHCNASPPIQLNDNLFKEKELAKSWHEAKLLARNFTGQYCNLQYCNLHLQYCNK